MPHAASPDLTGRTAIILTVSDRCHAGTQADLSGPALAGVLTAANATILRTQIVPDDSTILTTALRQAAAEAQLILTTGGTGLAPRDITPESTLAVIDRQVPGIAELIRYESAKQTPFAYLSRGICGTLGIALILNLPGSPRGAESSLRSVLHLLPHALDLLAGNTNH
jgi:molybdopterin adenylyltransferase